VEPDARENVSVVKVREEPENKGESRGLGQGCAYCVQYNTLPCLAEKNHNSYPLYSARIPPYRHSRTDPRGGSAHLGHLGTRPSSKCVILRSPENIADANSDTEDGWDREYCSRIHKISKPKGKGTRSMGLHLLPRGSRGRATDQRGNSRGCKPNYTCGLKRCPDAFALRWENSGVD